MDRYKQGDIVWADYPLSDKPDKAKIRPVIIISNATSNALDNDLLIVPVTSKIRYQAYEIVLSGEKLTVPLPALSAVRCNKLHTIRNSRISGTISSVSEDCLREIVDTVYESIRLPREDKSRI